MYKVHFRMNSGGNNHLRFIEQSQWVRFEAGPLSILLCKYIIQILPAIAIITI